MIRTATMSVVAALALSLSALPVSAQVYVRVPFVEVDTGNGVYVRAPFVRIWIPPSYVNPPPASVPSAPAQSAPTIPNPPREFVPAPQSVEPAPPAPQSVQPTPPAPQSVQPTAPAPLQEGFPTLADFARTFQARPGSYNFTLIHPFTGQPVQVHFALPEGTPRRVIVNRDEIEFRYSLRQFVRIEFNRNGGVVVTSR